MLLASRTRVLRQVIVLATSLALSSQFATTIPERLDSRSIAPPAISVPPSQEFDGDDGPWSTFTLQIGNPPQNVKVFISTYATQTWAIAEEGCGSGDLTDCAKLRGGLYNYTASTSWAPNVANLTTQIYGLGLESNLGYSGNGRYGFDDITLGFQGSGGPSLKNQTLAGVATKDFFVGIFGLKPMPSNFTDFNNPIPSFMENLRNQSMIPSTSWAYTAGNQYRSSEVLGSLTLGGYDASKFTPNNLTFNFSTNDQPDLAVQITSITALNSSSVSTSTDPITLLSTPITTYLDSTIPYLYLPLSTCNLIQSTFGLKYNSTTQLYTISSTQHTLLMAQNPSIKFTLTRPDSLGSPITLSFPYLAFALKATWPLVDTPTLYFPIKQANDSSQYRLGRAFFQEAYIIADYERRNFSVSQVRYDIPAQNIIPIIPPSNSTTVPTSTKNATGLSIGAIAGIGSASGILLISLIALLYYICIHRPRNHHSKTAAEFASQPLTSHSPPTSPYPQSSIDLQSPLYLYQKAELPTTSPSLIHEADSDMHSHFPQEIDSSQKQTQKQVIFELPAREEVAAEVPGSANLSQTLLAEQEEARLRKEKNVQRPKKQKQRWSWDRRRRASLGEKSLGLGSEATETTSTDFQTESESRTEVGTETETMSSGWGSTSNTLSNSNSNSNSHPYSYAHSSPISSLSGVATVQGKGEKERTWEVELTDFGPDRKGGVGVENRDWVGDAVHGGEQGTGTMSTISSGWVSSPRSAYSELR